MHGKMQNNAIMGTLIISEFCTLTFYFKLKKSSPTKAFIMSESNKITHRSYYIQLHILNRSAENRKTNVTNKQFILKNLKNS
jgi:hypothetical protein